MAKLWTRISPKQRELLRWIDGRIPNPPEYPPDGLADALARLRGMGLISPLDRASNELTGMGRKILSEKAKGVLTIP